MTDVSNQFELTRENLQNKGLKLGFKDLSTAIASLIRDREDALGIFEYILSEAENLAGLVTNSSEGFEPPAGLMNDADYKAMQQAIDQNFESWQFIHKALLAWDIVTHEELEVGQQFDRVSEVLQGYSIAVQNSCEDDEILVDEILSMSNVLHELQEMLKGLRIFYEDRSFSKHQRSELKGQVPADNSPQGVGTELKEIQKETLQRSQYLSSSSNQLIVQKVSILRQIVDWFNRVLFGKRIRQH